MSAPSARLRKARRKQRTRTAQTATEGRPFRGLTVRVTRPRSARYSSTGAQGPTRGDIDGWTPLAWAIQQDRPGAVEVLIDAGVKDLEKLEGSRSGLSWAVEYGCLRVVQVLLGMGADLESAIHQIPDLRTRKQEELATDLSRYLSRKLKI